ncbi:unnamed protein product [Didymodactylos carnosus]|uniref:Uncharacterized protein n=1 Tax=Didymodactylos carnosus TaxID=1234261 RepID=A0A8S2TKI0_9BILA|nr:unnamed protein product [Didymodactylos carnosus]CAF4292585.1 unnamed protein product [Didymodactylos carnosus]
MRALSTGTVGNSGFLKDFPGGFPAKPVSYKSLRKPFRDSETNPLERASWKTYNKSNDIRENLPLPLNIIPYCIRPSNISNIWNTSSAIIIQDTVHSFYELRVNNVTDRKLYRWSVDTNKIEKYQKYVEQFHLNSIEGKEVLYNCSQAWFGSKCEYTFNSHLTTFDQIVNERFDMKEEYDPAEILRITNGTCYWHLKCDQESLLTC